MFEIEAIKQTNIVPVASLDHLEAYADTVAPHYIVGKLLRFAKGEYLAGEKNEVIPTGTHFVAVVDELMAGWIKWQGGKPVEHIMVRVFDGKAPPKRDELGDGDQAQWELNDKGEPRDPWSFTNYLPLLETAAAELFTFTTTWKGGLQAIGNLTHRYVNHARRHPDVFPLIALSVGTYQHKNPQIGRVKYPDFAPAGYAPKKQFYDALEAAGYGSQEAVGDEAPEAPEIAAASPADSSAEEPPPVESEDAFADDMSW